MLTDHRFTATPGIILQYYSAATALTFATAACRHRARQHIELSRIRSGTSEEFDSDLEGRRRSETGHFVWDRRAADKVGPLVRWARANVARDPALRELSLDDQVTALTRLMPPNLIGKHAGTHIRWGLEAEHWRAQWRARVEGTPDLDAAVLTEQVRRILASGRHRECNDAIRALVRAEQGRPPVPEHPWERAAPAAPRLLGGWHDVDEFVATLPQRTAVRAVLAHLLERDGPTLPGCAGLRARGGSRTPAPRSPGTRCR